MSTTLINYAEEDEILAKRIYADLLAAGVRPWLAIYDLMPGERRSLADANALNACTHFVVLLTKKYFRDNDRVQLTEQAVEQGKTIIPIIADMGVKVPANLSEPIQLKRRYGDALKELIARLPHDDEPLDDVPAYQQGNEAYFIGDYEGAIEAYKSITDHTAASYNAYGAALNAMRQHENALEQIGKAIELESDNAAFYRNRSLALSALGRNDEALPDDAKAVELDPNAPQGWSSQAMTLMALEKFDDAKAAINRSLELAPNSAIYWYQLGLINDKAGNYDAALEAFDYALGLDPQNDSASIQRRMTLGHMGHYDEALADINREIKKNPRKGGAYVTRSLMNFFLERYEDSVKDATDAMERGQDHQLPALFNRSIAHWKLGNAEQAQADLLLAIGMLPELKTESGIYKNAESEATATPAIEILAALKESGALDQLPKQ